MNPEELKLYTTLQPLFREKMGDWQVGDWFVLSHGTIPRCVCMHDIKEVEKYAMIRLPLPIDPRNPERGLSGMCKGLVTIGKALFKDNWFVQVRVEENGVYKCFSSFKGETPTLALLRALAVQEGVTP
jgi:hypothetical protein